MESRGSATKNNAAHPKHQEEEETSIVYLILLSFVNLNFYLSMLYNKIAVNDKHENIIS